MDIDILGNQINPNVIVIGVFHGDEPQGDYLIRQYMKIKSPTNLLMIPCLNKSGFKAGTRVNSNGVDLNRNFPTNNWVLGEKDDYFGGYTPASEEETKFTISIIEKYSPKAILTLHSPYKIVNYDCGLKISEGKELAKKISDIIGYPVEESIGYPTPGSFGTWAGIEHNIPTITLELDEKIPTEDLEEPVFKIFEMLESY